MQRRLRSGEGDRDGHPYRCGRRWQPRWPWCPRCRGQSGQRPWTHCACQIVKWTRPPIGHRLCLLEALVRNGGRGVKNWPSPNLALCLFRYFDLCSSLGHKIHVTSRQNGCCLWHCRERERCPRGDTVHSLLLRFRAFTNVPHACFAQPMSRNSRACSFHSSAYRRVWERDSLMQASKNCRPRFGPTLNTYQCLD